MASKRRSYDAFLRAAKKKYDLPHAKAQKLYRTLSERLDKPARVSDLKQHPRISKQEAEKAQRSRPRKRKPPERPKVPPGGGGVAKIPITSLRQYDELFYLDYDIEEFAGGLDYNGEE
jgi:hypothetical protein